MSAPDAQDDVDSDALQAQFDISMGLLHELASSWVKAVKLPKSSPLQLEKQLQEHMCRPPRSGVGAPAPENSGLSREADRLRHRLTQKNNAKKRHHEETTTQGPEVDSSDEGESRAGAIKKRAKVDPFSTGKKHKQSKKLAASTSQHEGNPSSSTRLDASSHQMDVDPAPPASPLSTVGGSLADSFAFTQPESSDTLAETFSQPSSLPSGSIENSPSVNSKPDPTLQSPANPDVLLNLTGVPPAVEVPSPSKKRRRRKKNGQRSPTT